MNIGNYLFIFNGVHFLLGINFLLILSIYYKFIWFCLVFSLCSLFENWLYLYCIYFHILPINYLSVSHMIYNLYVSPHTLCQENKLILTCWNTCQLRFCFSSNFDSLKTSFRNIMCNFIWNHKYPGNVTLSPYY